MRVDIFGLGPELFAAWLLVGARVIGLLATMPLIGERTVPWQTKVGLSLIIGFLLLPLAHQAGPVATDNFLLFGLAVMREAMVGIMIGYLARLLFGAFQFAINAIDFQMGLSFIQIVNPGLGASMSVMGQLLNTLMLLLFLELDGHHLLLRALAQAVAAVPLGVAVAAPEMAGSVIHLFSVAVAISFQIAMPVILVLLLIDVAMGIMGRVVPQLNVFLVSLPIKIMVGLVTLGLVLPTLAELLGRMLDVLAADLRQLIGMMS